MRRIGCLLAASPEPHMSQALLEVALAHSPRVEEAGPGLVYLDAAGLEGLFGGERQLGESLCAAAAARGLDVRGGIAGSRLGARVAARSGGGVTIVQPAEDAAYLAPAPLALLDLPEEMAARLDRWGIRTLGELAALPPAALFERLGSEGPRLQRLARGEDLRPLIPWAPAPPFEESAECEWGLDTLEPVTMLLADLAEKICARLVRRGLSADGFEWICRLAGRSLHEGSLALAAPMSEASAIAALLRVALESRPPQGVVEAVTLKAHPQRVAPAQDSLTGRSRPSPRLVTAALTRLIALVGARQLGIPALLDSHRPDAVRLDPFLHPHPDPLPRRERESGSLSPSERSRVRSESLSPSGGEGRVRGREMSPALALRRLRPPCPAHVTLTSGRPVHLRSAALAGRIVTGAGPWRASGEWWTGGPWARDEWDVELADGTVCRLVHDGSAWFLDGIYD
jgi:protein ImuB